MIQREAVLQTRGDRCTVIAEWCVAHQRRAGHLEAIDADSPLRAADQVFLVEGRCLQCDRPVARAVRRDGPYAMLGRWVHTETDKDTQHGVTNVLPPADL